MDDEAFHGVANGSAWRKCDRMNRPAVQNRRSVRLGIQSRLKLVPAHEAERTGTESNDLAVLLAGEIYVAIRMAGLREDVPDLFDVSACCQDFVRQLVPTVRGG